MSSGDTPTPAISGGFFGDALVIYRTAKEHYYRIEEEDSAERNKGHTKYIKDLHCGDFVLDKSGGYAEILDIIREHHSIADWLWIGTDRPRYIPCAEFITRDGHILTQEQNGSWIHSSERLTFCLRDTFVLAKPAYKPTGLEIAVIDQSYYSDVANVPMSQMRSISDIEDYDFYLYDYETAQEWAKHGVLNPDEQMLSDCVTNLYWKPYLISTPIKIRQARYVHADTLDAYALVTTSGTYVADGFYAKCP